MNEQNAGAEAPGPNRSEEPFSVALDHAVRRWDAETENAARLANRENGILTLIVAVVSIGLFNANDVIGVRPMWLSFVLRGLLTLALLSMGWAMLKILFVWLSSEEDDSQEANADAGLQSSSGSAAPDVQIRRQIYASGYLKWPPAPEIHPERLATAREAYAVAYKRTSRAANSLHLRNLRRKSSIDAGQHWLLRAGVLVGIAALCYMWFSYGSPPTPAPAEVASDSAPK